MRRKSICFCPLVAVQCDYFFQVRSRSDTIMDVPDRTATEDLTCLEHLSADSIVRALKSRWSEGNCYVCCFFVLFFLYIYILYIIMYHWKYAFW